MSPWENALEKAKKVKADRTRLRALVRAPRDYSESRRVVARLLITPQPALHRMRALDLLLWIWGMYEKKAKRMLDVAGASEYVIVGRLTVRQRVLLARLLRGGDDVLHDEEMEQLARLARRTLDDQRS